MAFILRGWQPRLEERPEAFELMELPRVFKDISPMKTYPCKLTMGAVL